MLITDGPTIELEHLLLCQNIKHFSQAEVTPLASLQVMHKIVFGAQSRISKLIPSEFYY